MRPGILTDSKGVLTSVPKELSNIQIVTIAVYLLGGDTRYVDTEDVAIRANEFAPGRFVWRKYPDQVNKELVRVYLSDAKKPDKGQYLIGDGTRGWMLTEIGLDFAKRTLPRAEKTDLSREPLSEKERKQRRAERGHLVASEAFTKYQAAGRDGPSVEEIEAMFRVNAYVLGKARETKITRIVNTFGDDDELGPAVKELAERLRREAK